MPINTIKDEDFAVGRTWVRKAFVSDIQLSYISSVMITHIHIEEDLFRVNVSHNDGGFSQGSLPRHELVAYFEPDPIPDDLPEVAQKRWTRMGHLKALSKGATL